MNRKAMGLLSCLVAVFAVSAVVSAMASAVTLPRFAVEAGTKFTGRSGPMKLEVAGGANISCTSGTVEGEVESPQSEGTMLFAIVGCGTPACRSLGQTLDAIVATAQWSLVPIVVAHKEVHLFLVLVQGLHIECPGAAVELLLITGQFISVIEAPVSEKTKVFTVKAVVKAGAQEFSEFENDSGTKVAVSLKTSQEGGKAKTTTVNQESTIEFGKATEIEN